MTIEEEIRQRLRAMGMDEERVDPCMEYVKADPMMRAVKDRWECTGYCEHFSLSVWHCAKSSALDYLEKKYHIEARKSPVAMNNDGEEKKGL